MKTKDKWLIKKSHAQETLHKAGGDPVECIYKGPIMLPHPQISGQVVIKVTPCGTACPMFELKGEAFGKLKLHCTGRELDIYNDDNQQQKLKLI